MCIITVFIHNFSSVAALDRFSSGLYVITAVLPPLYLSAVVYAQCGGPSEVMVTATHLSSNAYAN